MLPTQFFADATEDFRLPERRLMLAILLDAVECLRKYRDSRNPQRRALFEQEQAWLICRDATSSLGDGSFSFEYVCDVLGFEAVAVRDHLRRTSATSSETKPDR